MTMPSRGISSIQEKARGTVMKPKKMDVKKAKLSVRTPPTDRASVGPAMSAGPVPGMKKGGSCKGYAKGGSIDGCAKKGHTKGKMV